MTDARNRTNGDDRSRGVEIVCFFFGLSTKRTRRFVNRKTRIYQGASRSDNVAYNLAIYSACLQESVNFCVHFQKSRFFRKTQQESVDFYHHFLVGRSGRVGPGRFVACRRRPKIKKRLKNHTFIVIGNGHIELSK